MATSAPPDGKLADISKGGTAVKSRIADPQHMRTMCERMVRDDVERMKRRATVQGAFNGNAPKSGWAMKNAGRENDSNLNFKRHRGFIMNAWVPFFDLVCEVPVCIDGDLEIGDSAQDMELMRGFAEYFHDLQFGWRAWDDTNQLCDLQMLLHGPGLLAWEDQWDWRPKAILAGNFYVPQGTSASLDNCECALITSPISAGQLWRKIEDEKAAEVMGWNVEAVKKTIMDSARSNHDARNWKWEKWEQMFKNGDLYVSDAITKTIYLYNLFVEEMDGTISLKIQASSRGAGEDDAFLFNSKTNYDNWDQGVCVFPYDIGADGTYHSIKGMGTDIFPFCELLNKIDNALADLAVTGIKPMWQPTTAGKMEEFQMITWGGGKMIPQGINPLSLEVGRNLEPGLAISREFTNTLSRNTGGYNQNDLAAPTVEETAKSAMIRAMDRGKLTKGAHNRYMRGKDRQYRETWRRACNPKLRKHHPGAQEALKFQQRCKRLCAKLGVEWERTLQADESPTGEAGKFTVLELVTNVRANRSLGLGSAAMRVEIVNQLMSNIDRFDEVGQNEIKRMFVAVMTSFHQVDSIVPSLTSGRDPTNDASVASMEDNAFALLGPDAEAEVVPGQNHVIHLGVHIPSMQKDVKVCQAGQMDPRECAKRLEGKAIHSAKHLAILETNPTRQREFKEFSAALAEIAAYQDHLQQNIEAENAAAEAEPPPGAPDPDLVKVQGNLDLKAQKDQGNMELKAQKQQFDQQLKAMQVQFDQRIADLEAAAKIQRDNRVAVVKAQPEPELATA